MLLLWKKLTAVYPSIEMVQYDLEFYVLITRVKLTSTLICFNYVWELVNVGILMRFILNAALILNITTVIISARIS